MTYVIVTSSPPFHQSTIYRYSQSALLILLHVQSFCLRCLIRGPFPYFSNFYSRQFRSSLGNEAKVADCSLRVESTRSCVLYNPRAERGYVLSAKQASSSRIFERQVMNNYTRDTVTISTDATSALSSVEQIISQSFEISSLRNILFYQAKPRHHLYMLFYNVYQNFYNKRFTRGCEKKCSKMSFFTPAPPTTPNILR